MITSATLYAGSMIGLYQLWYKDYAQSNFHFFNDNNEWLQMDKLGHFTTAYYISRIGFESLRWCGLDSKPAAWLGSMSSFLFLTTIEVFDGFSSEWGASPGDLIANTGGMLLFASQQTFWSEQRMLMKFSFRQSNYAAHRPDLLGKSFVENLVKDYNGQTYWLSVNLKSFLKKNSKLPAWLNLAIGYGAEGMTGSSAESSISVIDPGLNFKRYRQFYLAPDIDISRIKTRHNGLGLFLKTFGFIKFPLPCLEYNTVNGFIFHGIYF